MGAYLVFHLMTNASILDGPAAYQHRVEQLHRLGPTTIFILEWPLIFLPLLFHGLLGAVIVMRGKRNLKDYPYTGNIRYTLQRFTGVVALLFVLYHVFHMHGWIRPEWRPEWYQKSLTGWGGGKFEAEYALSAAAAVQAAAWIQVVYVIGVLASVYHLANGLWTFGITWGIWTSPKAQRWANYPAIALGVFLGAFGLAAIVALAVAPADPSHGPGATSPAAAAALGK